MRAPRREARRPARRRSRRRRAAASSSPSGVSGANPSHSVSGVEPARSARKRSICSPREERGVVLRPPGDLEPVALDRVREDRRSAARSSRARRRSASRTSPRSWPPRSRTSAPTSPAYVVEQPREPSRARRPRAPSSRAPRTTSSLGAEERLVLLVRHLVDPAAEQVAALARERLAQPAAVLELDHVPAARPELRLELGGPDAGDDAVERLPVEVDDPERRSRARASAARRPPPRCCPRRARRRRAGR